MKPAAVKIWTACLVLTVAVAAGYGFLHRHSVHRISTAVNRITEALPAVAKVEMDRIRPGLLDGRIVLENLSVRPASGGAPIAIDSVEMFDTEFARRVPRQMHLVVKGARLEPGIHFPGVFGHFPAGAVSGSVVLNLEMVYVYRPDVGEVDLAVFTLAAERLGALSISGRFDNLDLDRIVQAPVRPVELFGALVGARILEAEFTYRDHALVREAIRADAARRGRSPARHARILVETLRLRGEGRPGGLLARTLEPLKGFLADPERLRISIRPKQPVTVGWLLWVRDPERLIDLLGIRLEA